MPDLKKLKMGDTYLPFKIDKEYKSSSGFPEYPEGPITELIVRCKNFITEMTSTFIRQNKDLVLIIVTHEYCFNALQESCIENTCLNNLDFCAVSRLMWDNLTGNWNVDVCAKTDHLINN